MPTPLSLSFISEGQSRLVIGTADWVSSNKGDTLIHTADAGDQTARNNDLAAMSSALHHLHIPYTLSDNHIEVIDTQAQKVRQIIEATKFISRSPQKIIYVAGQSEGVLENEPEHPFVLIPAGNLTARAKKVIEDALKTSGIQSFTDFESTHLGSAIRVKAAEDIEKIRQIKKAEEELAATRHPLEKLSTEQYEQMHSKLVVSTAQWRQDGHILMIMEADNDKNTIQIMEKALSALGIGYKRKSVATGGPLEKILHRSNKSATLVIDERSAGKVKETIEEAAKMHPHEIVQAAGITLMEDVHFARLLMDPAPEPVKQQAIKALEALGYEVGVSGALSDNEKPSYYVSGDIKKLGNILNMVPPKAIWDQRDIETRSYHR